MLTGRRLIDGYIHLHELLPGQKAQRPRSDQHQQTFLSGKEIILTHREYSYREHTYQKLQRKAIILYSSSGNWETPVNAGNHVKRLCCNSDRQDRIPGIELTAPIRKNIIYGVLFESIALIRNIL